MSLLLEELASFIPASTGAVYHLKVPKASFPLLPASYALADAHPSVAIALADNMALSVALFSL